MKKINLLFPLTILLSLLVLNSKAQNKKGAFNTGINFSASNAKQFDSTGKMIDNKHRLNISPYINYALKNNYSIGVNALLNSTHNGIFSFSKNNHNYSVAVFVRKYMPVSTKFYTYLQTDLKYAAFSGGIFYNTNYTSKSISLNLSAGLGYKISNRIGIELGANNIAGVGLFNKSTSILSGKTYKSTKPTFNAGNVFQANGLHLGVTFKF